MIVEKVPSLSFHFLLISFPRLLLSLLILYSSC
jgi:hypothetical protein